MYTYFTNRLARVSPMEPVPQHTSTRVVRVGSASMRSPIPLYSVSAAVVFTCVHVRVCLVAHHRLCASIDSKYSPRESVCDRESARVCVCMYVSVCVRVYACVCSTKIGSLPMVSRPNPPTI